MADPQLTLQLRTRTSRVSERGLRDWAAGGATGNPPPFISSPGQLEMPLFVRESLPSSPRSFEQTTLGGRVTGVRGSNQSKKIGRGGQVRGSGAIIRRRVRGIEEGIIATNSMSGAAQIEIETRAKQFKNLLISQLRSQTAAAYRTGTGRFSRGLNARVHIKKGSDNQPTEATVEVLVPQYRESRFLTNLGNQGRFKEFPVAPYWIYARGASSLEMTHSTTTEPMTKKEVRSLQARLKRSKRVGRLKIPMSDIGLISRAPAGKRRETIVEAGFPLEPGMSASSQFVYPLQVLHPGFARDVVSEVTFALGQQYQEGIINSMTDIFVPKKTPLVGGMGIGGASSTPEVPMGSPDDYVRVISNSARNLAIQRYTRHLKSGG